MNKDNLSKIVSSFCLSEWYICLPMRGASRQDFLINFHLKGEPEASICCVIKGSQ